MHQIDILRGDICTISNPMADTDDMFRSESTSTIRPPWWPKLRRRCPRTSSMRWWRREWSRYDDHWDHGGDTMRHNYTKTLRHNETPRDTTWHDKIMDEGMVHVILFVGAVMEHAIKKRCNVWWWSMKPQVYTEMAEKKFRQMQVCAVGRLTKKEQIH